MNQVLMIIMAAGAVAGGIDRMLGNKRTIIRSTDKIIQ